MHKDAQHDVKLAYHTYQMLLAHRKIESFHAYISIKVCLSAM